MSSTAVIDASRDLISSTIFRVVFSLVLIYFFFPDYNRGHIIHGLPIAGRKWPFEPRIVTRYRAVTSHFDIVTEAVKKYKDEPFTVLRPDSSITYISRRFLPELSRLPDDVIDHLRGQVVELVPRYTRTDILYKPMTPRILMTKVNQHIDHFAPIFEEEFDIGLSEEMPKSDTGNGWAELDPRQTLAHIMSRNAARLMGGPRFCRNPEFLRVNNQIAEVMFGTIIALRMFPEILQPVIAQILPMPRRYDKLIQDLENFMGPMIEERRCQGPTANKENEDVTQWHLEFGTGEQLETRNLVLRYVFTSLASLGAVLSTLSKALYELCEDPALFEILRKEVREVLKENDGKWTKRTAERIVKMDSFLKECLRTNLQSCVPFRRVVSSPAGLTLSSGLHLPPGTIFAIPASDPSLDPIPNAASFKPFRWIPPSADHPNPDFPANLTTNQEPLTTPSLASHQWGYGRYPCPGRFIADMEMKMLLAKLILGWDWRWKEGDPRGKMPPHLKLFELQFWNPDPKMGGILEVKKRDVEVAS